MKEIANMVDMNHLKLEESVSALERGAERVGSAVSTLGEEAKRIVKERPGAVLLGALALGFVVGRLLSRR